MGYIGRVPADFLSDLVDSSSIVDGSIITADIANDAITTAKLATNSVDSAEIIDGSVDNSHLAGSIAMNKTLLAGGTGLTLSTNTLNVDAAQTQITSLGTIAAFRSTGIDDNADALAITIDSSERVGIRATPLYPLHVNTSTNKNFMVRDSVAPTGGVMLQSVNDADSAATAMEFRGSLFSFQVGRVGIGTTTPNATLHIGSTASFGTEANPAIQIGESTGYRGGLYTDSEGLFISNKNGDDGVKIQVRGNVAFQVDDNQQTNMFGNADVVGNLTAGTIASDAGISGTTGTFSGILSSNSHLIVANGYSIKGGSGQEQIINMDGTTINIGGENNIVNTGTGAWTFGGNVEINGSSLTVDSTGNAILYMDGGDANYSGVWFGQLGDKRWEIVNHPTADKLYFNSGAGDNKISFTQAGDATFTGTIASGAESSVGIGTAQADANVAEVGPGYINLARDDTANAKQIQFTKNGSVHSYLETKGTGLAIGGAGVTMTGGDFEVYDADSTFGGDVDVTGTINLTSLSVTDGSAAAPSLSFSGDTDTGFYRAGADSMVLVTGGSPVLYMKSGYMGIGRGNPQAPLHIEKDADNTVADLLKITNSNDPAAGETGQKARITFQLRGSNDNGSNYYDTDAGRITVGKDADFITNNWTDADSYMSFETMVNGTETERMRIDSQGRVGIGQSPDGAFAVKGYVDDHHQVLELSAYDGDSLFNVRQSANNALIRAYADGGAQKIALHTAGESYFTGGNVGIGTSTPDFLLDVESTGTPTICVRNSAASADAKIIIGEPNTTAYGLEMKWKGSTGCAYFDNRYDHSSNPHMYFRMKTSGTPITALTINPAGNVGIGATPLYPLHVNTSTDKNLMVRDSVAPTGGVMLQSVNDADSAATAMELRGSLFSFQVGNVGIGQESPAEILDIGANTNADNVGYAIRLHESDTKSWDIQTTGGATSAERGLQFEQSQGGVAMTIRGDGKVGIGDASPSEKFRVKGNEAAFITKLHNEGTGTNNHGLAVEIDGSNASATVFSAASAGGKMVLKGDGKLGIGTANPASIAHINSPLTSPTLEIGSTVSPTGSVSGGILTLGLHNASDSGSGGDDTRAGDVLGQIYFKGQGTDYTYQGGRIACIVQTGDGTATRGEQGTYMNFSTMDTSGVAFEERMRIDQDGNVGIGVTDPDEKLEVAGASHFGNRIDLYPGGNSTKMAILGSRGDIGSGAANATDLVIKQMVEDKGIALQTYDGVVMYIEDGGNVGINETTPEVKLEIVGAGRFTSEGAASNSSTGKGMELQYATSNRAQGEGSYIISYDRDNSAYKPLHFDASSFTFNTGNATFAGHVGINGGGVVHPLEVSGGHIQIDSNKNYTWSGNYTHVAGNGANTTGHLSLLTSDVTRLKIMGDGKIGIGTTSPSGNVEKLHVKGTQATAGNTHHWGIYSEMETASTGTQTDNQIQAIRGECNTKGDFVHSATSSPLRAGMYQIIHSSTGTIASMRALESRLYLAANKGTVAEAEMMRCEWEIGSGTTVTNLFGLKIQNVGGTGGTETNSHGIFIGAMQGATKSYGIYQDSSADTNFFNGKVGIGLSSPSYPLHVSGGVKIQAASIGNFVFSGVGSYAVRAKNDSGNLHIGGGNIYLEYGASDSAVLSVIGASGKVMVNNAPDLGTAKLQVLGASTTSLGDPQMVVHGRENNGYQTIGLGHIEASYPESPAEIGFLETNNGGGTYGDLIFATRAGTTGAPTTRLTIDSDGNSTFAGDIINRVPGNGTGIIRMSGATDDSEGFLLRHNHVSGSGPTAGSFQIARRWGGSDPSVGAGYAMQIDGGGATTFTGTIASGSITATGFITCSSSLFINSGERFYLDGGSDTYINEFTANHLGFFTGGTEALRFTDSQNAQFAGTIQSGSITSTGSLTAGSNHINQDSIYLDGGYSTRIKGSGATGHGKNLEFYVTNNSTNASTLALTLAAGDAGVVGIATFTGAVRSMFDTTGTGLPSALHTDTKYRLILGNAQLTNNAEYGIGFASYSNNICASISANTYYNGEYETQLRFQTRDDGDGGLREVLSLNKDKSATFAGSITTNKYMFISNDDCFLEWHDTGETASDGAGKFRWYSNDDVFQCQTRDDADSVYTSALQFNRTPGDATFIYNLTVNKDVKGGSFRTSKGTLELANNTWSGDIYVPKIGSNNSCFLFIASIDESGADTRNHHIVDLVTRTESTDCEIDHLATADEMESRVGGGSSAYQVKHTMGSTITVTWSVVKLGDD